MLQIVIENESSRSLPDLEKKMINKVLKDSRLGIIALAVLVFAANAFGQGSYAADFNGSYRIDQNQSDDVSSMVESIANSNGLSAQQKSELEDRLTSPNLVSIKADPNYSTRVTLWTSSSAETTFQADGSTQNVGQANVTATIRNGVLRLSRVDGNSSFSVTFRAVDNGSGLKVTRMVTTGYLNQTVYADSYYSKIGSYAAGNSPAYDPDGDNDSDGGYSSSDPGDVIDDQGSTSGSNYPRTKTVNGKFIVPQGVVLSGTLNNKITTKASRNNDRFSFTVESPQEYRGAVVEGYLTGVQRTGRATGTSRITFNFETIRLRAGEIYDFAGVLQSVTDSTGKIIKIGDEGEAKSDSKTKETVKRGGIGAGLGAIIGGILGGGKGAIIGATIGGGAGAGSVIVEGKDDLELLPGSTVVVESSSPRVVRR